MTLEFDDWGIDVYISSAWVALKNDVLQSPGPRWGRGVLDNGPLDRVGDSTTLMFSLMNHEGNSAGLAGYYSPGHPNALAGWTTGLPVRLWFKFEGRTFYKFYGLIEQDGIAPDAGLYTRRTVKVSVQNFMAQAANAEVNLLALATDQTIDSAMDLLIANMTIQPLSTSYAAGVDTFPTMFDASGVGTSPISEMNKLALSEWGMVSLPMS